MSETGLDTLNFRSLPLPLCARRDLRFQEMQFQGGLWHVVKDPLALHYFRLREEERRVLELLDGTRSIEELLARLHFEFPAVQTTCRDLQLLITDLSRKGLIGSTRTGRAKQILGENRKRSRKRFLAALLSPLFIKLPGWNSQPVLQRLYPLVRWMFHPWAVFLTLIFVAASWLQVAIRFDEIHNRLPALSSVFGSVNMFLLWITLGVTKMVHEFAHGLACRHFGGECHEIGVAFLVFSPCLYCDVSDSWMLPRKRDRILVAAAGIYIEVLISAVALTLWSWTQPGLLSFLLLNAFMVTAVTTVIYNANPLLRYDGYYMLADWLEIPNLRTKADQEVRQLFLKVCTGLSLPVSIYAPTGDRLLFVAYAFAAMLNRGVLVLLITGFLFHVLRPFGLQNLALITTGLSVSVGFYRFFAGICQSISFAGSDSMKSVRIATALLTLIGIATASLMIPLPVHGHAPLVVEPAGMRNIYSQVDGVVDEILVSPGETVVVGQPMLRLRSEALQLERTELQAKFRKCQLEVALARATNESSRLELAVESIRSVDEERSSLEQKVKQLTIVAPCGGVLIAPPSAQEMNSSTFSSPHEGRSDGPLEAKNQGTWLAARTHIGSIAPQKDEWQASLFVDQAGREKMQPGEKVEIKLSDRPGDVLIGHVLTVAPREENLVPASLSVKFGGPMATITDAVNGGERVTSAVYQATVVIEKPDAGLFTGMRGTGRFEVSQPSLVGWIGIQLHRTFYVSH